MEIFLNISHNLVHFGDKQ